MLLLKRTVRCAFQEMPRTRTRKTNKSRGWVLTVNNISDDELELLKSKIRTKENVHYFCGQLEVGESGTRHLQAYVEFRGPLGLTAVCKLFPRCHAEVREGTPQQARTYCSKEESAVPGTFFEFGELPQKANSRQGARGDLDAVRAAISGGSSVRSIIEQFPVTYARYPRFVERCLIEYTAHRSWKTEVRVYVGPTGCGKTSSALEEFPDLWFKPDGAWFDGYSGQPNVIFDDFHGGRDCGISWPFMLRLLDRYRMVVPVKGSFVNWVPKLIIITSNYSPEQWYPWEDPAPLLRRIDVLKRWNKE